MCLYTAAIGSDIHCVFEGKPHMSGVDLESDFDMHKTPMLQN